MHLTTKVLVSNITKKYVWRHFSRHWCCTVASMDWLPLLTWSISSQQWSTPEGLKLATDRSSATQACTAKPSFPVQLDYGTPCQLMSASCHQTALRLNWTPSSWCNCRLAMFLTAPLHCFYLLLFGFLFCTAAVLTTCTAHTCTYTAVRYCSTTESAPLLDEDKDCDCG